MIDLGSSFGSSPTVIVAADTLSVGCVLPGALDWSRRTEPNAPANGRFQAATLVGRGEPSRTRLQAEGGCREQSREQTDPCVGSNGEQAFATRLPLVRGVPGALHPLSRHSPSTPAASGISAAGRVTGRHSPSLWAGESQRTGFQSVPLGAVSGVGRG